MRDERSPSAARGLDRIRKLRDRALELAGKPPSEWAPEQVRDLTEVLGEMSRIFEEHEVAEEELREQAETLEATNMRLDQERLRYRELFDSAPNPYIVTDARGRIEEVNAAAASLLENDPVRLTGKPLALFVPTGERFRFREQMHAALQTEEPRSWAGRLRTGGGETELEFLVCRTPEDAGSGQALRWILRDVTDERRAAAEIKESRRRLQTLTWRVISAREEERARVAREIHDQLGGDLTALKIEIQWLLERLPSGGGEEADRRIERMRSVLDGTVEAVRDLATQLRPPVLDLGLVPALEWQIDEFSRRTGISCRFAVPDRSISVGADCAISIFRMTQETLSNVARHAAATEVQVSIERRPGSLLIEIRDNGRGITPEAVESASSLGLAGLRESLDSLSGDLEIRGEPGKGTTVAIKVPVEDGFSSADEPRTSGRGNGAHRSP